MARIAVLAFAIALAVVIRTPGGRPAAVTPALAQAPLPPGEGAVLVVSRCLICHSTEIATQQRQGPRGWTEIVDRMATYGDAADDAGRASDPPRVPAPALR